MGRNRTTISAIFIGLIITAILCFSSSLAGLIPRARSEQSKNIFSGLDEILARLQISQEILPMRARMDQTQEAFATQNELRIPMGIIEDASHASFLPKNFIVGNAWFNKIENKLIQVFAGADGNDPEQGALIVFVPQDYSIGLYRSPNKRGILRIIGELGLTLILEAEDGSRYYFNIPGRKFTSTLLEIVPTITPVKLLPSSTPAPSPTIFPRHTNP